MNRPDAHGSQVIGIGTTRAPTHIVEIGRRVRHLRCRNHYQHSQLENKNHPYWAGFMNTNTIDTALRQCNLGAIDCNPQRPISKVDKTKYSVEGAGQVVR